MVIYPEYFFNDNSITIFTDASFRNSCIPGVGTTAPAALVYHNDKLIETNFNILHYTTSQVGELHAILLGVMLAYKYRNYKIRLFSDSMNSIFAIRDRIFKWVNMYNNGSNNLGDNGTIKNQEDIMQIIYYIISNNIPMEFYHVKGHVKTNDKQSMKHAKDIFYYSNSYVLDNNTLRIISDRNNAVDMFSTKMLKEHIRDKQFNTTGFTKAVSIGYTDFDMGNYFNLVNFKDKA